MMMLMVGVEMGRVKRQIMMGNRNNNNYNNNYNNRQPYNGGGGGGYGRSNVQQQRPGSSRGGSSGRGVISGCQVPNGIDNPLTPARQNQQIEIRCNTDTEYDGCIFTHTKPENVGQSYGSNSEDLKCSIGHDAQMYTTCEDDSRITLIRENSMCGIRISNPIPSDSGIWKVYTSELKNGQMEGKGSYDRHELLCVARYGRPQPEIVWRINNDQNELRSDGTFTIRDGKGDTHGSSGIVYDWESEISFTVDREFLDYLESEHGIDTNPQSGSFSFDLECDTIQGQNGEYWNERITTRINVNKVYDSGRLTANQIGMIVGIVLGVLVLMIIVAAVLLIFAKSTERWCFANDDYQYRAPQDKRVPPSHDQVHSDDLDSKPIVKTKTSSSSSHSSR